MGRKNRRKGLNAALDKWKNPSRNGEDDTKKRDFTPSNGSRTRLNYLDGLGTYSHYGYSWMVKPYEVWEISDEIFDGKKYWCVGDHAEVHTD